jgi:hypothetical protein
MVEVVLVTKIYFWEPKALFVFFCLFVCFVCVDCLANKSHGVPLACLGAESTIGC